MGWFWKRDIKTMTQKDPDVHGKLVQPEECPHGEMSGCARCFMEEINKPEPNTVPMNASDIRKAVLKLPEQISSLLRTFPNKLYVAGGYLRSIIANEPVYDYDIFCPEGAEMTKGYIRSSAFDNYSVVKSENAYTLSAEKAHCIAPVQFIFRWKFTDAKGLLNSFDLTIAKAAIWYNGSEWSGIVDERYYQDLAAKRLVYNFGVAGRRGAAHVARLLKFVSRGYYIESEDLANILTWTIAELDSVKPVDRPTVKGELLKSLEEMRQISGANWQTISLPLTIPDQVEKHSYYNSS